MKAPKKIIALLLLALVAVAVTLPSTPVVAAPPDSQFNPNTADQQQVKEVGFRQKDLVNLLKALRGRITTSGLLAAGTTGGKIKTLGAVNYQINGALLNKAATDDFCVTNGTNITATTAAYYRLEINAAGTCTVTQGPVVTVSSGTVETNAPLPGRSTKMATLGVVLISGTAFTAGTTAVTAGANIIYTNGDPDLIDLLEPQF